MAYRDNGRQRAGHRRAQIELPARAWSLRAARTAVRDALAAWGLDDPDHLVELVANELVANAVRHVGEDFCLSISADATIITLVVQDPSSAVPVRRVPDERGGRGLNIVEAVAASWGVERYATTASGCGLGSTCNEPIADTGAAARGGGPMPPEHSGDDLIELIRLPDDTPARLRALVGTDRQLLQDMYAALSHVSRRGRFLAAPPRLSELTLDHLVDAVDQIDHVAILLLAPAGNPDEQPVGVGRIIRYTTDPSTADIAIAVADRWQRRGVGTALARALLAHRPHGVTHLVTVVAAHNTGSLATLRRLGTIERVLTDGVYDVTVALPT